MAAEGHLGEFCSESARLREEIVNFITRRLEESISKKPKNLELGKILCKRKRKWRKKHKLDTIKPAYKPVDDQLREEKETTEGTQLELKDNLLHRRQEAITLARQLEKEKGEYQLESISYRLQASQDSFKANLLSQQNDVPPVEPELSRAEQLDQLLAEIEGIMEQASTLRSIRQMKHTMTPRFPPLHNRTLSGNVLDTTLGLLRAPGHLEVDSSHSDSPPLDSSPLDTTNIAPELHAIDQDSEAEVEERLEVTSSPEKEMARLNSFSLQETHREDGSKKTYANVRLSAESVPLQLSSVDQTMTFVESNPPPDDLETAPPPPPLPLSPPPPSPPKPALPLPDISVVDDEAMVVDTVPETKTSDSQIEPPHLQPTTPSPIDTLAPLQEDDGEETGGTYTKNTPVLDKNQAVTDLIVSSDLAATICRDEEMRAITEHSYAKVCSDDGLVQRGTAASNDTFVVSPRPQINEHQLVSDNHSMITACEVDTMREAPSIIDNVIESNLKDISVFNSNQESEEVAHLQYPLVVEGTMQMVETNPPPSDLETAPPPPKSTLPLQYPLVAEGSRVDGLTHLPVHSEEVGGEMTKNMVHNSEGVLDGLHEPMTLLPSAIGDEVLEVAMIEPKSDFPMPVEYTVVTQQEITEEPPPKEKTPPPPVEHIFDNTHLVNEESNESGESIMIGCEVTTSTMELTDVTDFNSGSSSSTTERQAPADFTVAEDISCETVIITTSAMNSTRSGGYTTPSEDSDGTTNSLEEKETRGDGAGPPDDKPISNMTNDDGNESDVAFEDILKQIESAPYELRISNIVLAELASRAVSKSPPCPSSKKKRKRRSTAKKWSRTKARKSTTPNNK